MDTTISALLQQEIYNFSIYDSQDKIIGQFEGSTAQARDGKSERIAYIDLDKSRLNEEEKYGNIRLPVSTKGTYYKDEKKFQLKDKINIDSNRRLLSGGWVSSNQTYLKL